MNLTVQPIPSQEAAPWILKKHYAKRMPPISYAFGLFDRLICQGIVTFGPTPTPAVQQNILGEEMADRVYELNRLCVDSKEKNASSFLVSNALKLMPKPCCIVSYADEGMGHKGYIYQATNFLYTGAVTAHDSEYILNGKKVHARTITSLGHTAVKAWAKENNIEEVKPKPKHRYVMLLGSKKDVKEMRRKLRYTVLPNYPKGNSQRYDASTHIQTQTLLF